MLLRLLSFRHALSSLLLAAASSSLAVAQENYEVQVYGYETVAPGETMIEVHSNLTAEGTRGGLDGVAPTRHAVHETLEITRGLTPWFETGFYVFSSVQPDGVWSWVGDHVRPRVRAPESWHWPVGVSLSLEVGYQRRRFSTDTWSAEIRPIIDRKQGRWYWSLNPTLERALAGANADRGFEFSPNAKVSYDVTTRVSVGLEYYGAFGPVSGFDPAREQQQQIVPSVDLNVSPRWELNLGVGFGLTQATDGLLIKAIVGRRF